MEALHSLYERIVNLGPAEQIPLGEGRVFEVVDRKVAVFRARDGKLFATQASCPHQRGPLADGLVGGGKVICPLHGFRFDLATGQPLGNDCAALVTYRVERSEDGDVLLDVKAPLDAPAAKACSGRSPA